MAIGMRASEPDADKLLDSGQPSRAPHQCTVCDWRGGSATKAAQHYQKTGHKAEYVKLEACDGCGLHFYPDDLILNCGEEWLCAGCYEACADDPKAETGAPR